MTRLSTSFLTVVQTAIKPHSRFANTLPLNSGKHFSWNACDKLASLATSWTGYKLDTSLIIQKKCSRGYCRQHDTTAQRTRRYIYSALRLLGPGPDGGNDVNRFTLQQFYLIKKLRFCYLRRSVPTQKFKKSTLVEYSFNTN